MFVVQSSPDATRIAVDHQNRVVLCCASVTVFTYLQCLLTYIVHWQVMSGGKPTDALCLCEYDDVEGQRQHLMAACCDCEALDLACDRCSLYSID